MNAETYNLIIVLLTGVIVGLTFVAYKLGISLRDMLPPAFVPLVGVLLNTLVDLAKQTPTPADDELVAKLREALNPPTTPTEEMPTTIQVRVPSQKIN